MMLSIAGQLTDDDNPAAIIGQLLERLPSGSYLALSDGTDTNPALVRAVANYNRTAANTYQLRSRHRSRRSSPASTWWTPAWCRRRNGGPNLIGGMSRRLS
ncbi:hypothetical protein GCM10020219_057040 [Nonomuraea dietziae]